MTDQVVLITGALTGIGRATAIAFAKAGGRLIISGRHDDAGIALAAELRGLNTEAEFVRADTRHDDEVRAVIDRAVARFGRLDVAVNNAGTEGHPRPLIDETAETYAAVFDTNVLGVVLSMKHELRAMQSQKKGSIINLSSVAGHKGLPGVSLYVASKHAVEGLTKVAALEAAPFGVRVNAVGPGPIETDMLDRFTGDAAGKAAFLSGVPFKRAGTPEEVAQTIVFLASEQASFITGQVLSIDGGISAQ
jgi:NAD(P)-dependent dehydrogenase (short-subunit alcohol dehydrogenase family)